jgi:ABC-type Fe3+-hydroxamate transport system substrate-binding protein
MLFVTAMSAAAGESAVHVPLSSSVTVSLEADAKLEIAVKMSDPVTRTEAPKRTVTLTLSNTPENVETIAAGIAKR